MFGIIDKIFHTCGDGFIEDMGSGFLRHSQECQISTGNAAHVNRQTVKRLTSAMMNDDCLLAACIREARRLGHKIL